MPIQLFMRYLIRYGKLPGHMAMEEEKQYPILVKKNHHVYDKIFDQPEAKELMKELSNRDRLQPGRLIKIADQTKIEYKTLETWRRKLKADPNYLPKHGNKGRSKKISKEQEDIIFNKLQEKYLNQNLYCPPRIIKAIAKNEYNNYSFGDTWLEGFMNRYHLARRVPHLKRRSNPNDDHVASFLANLELVNMQFPADLILNVDETCWRITNGRLHTVAIRGADQVDVRMKEDPKKCLTVIACCTKAGERLPLWLIAKGKTQLCEKKFRNDQRLRHYIQAGKLIVDHSSNGWSNDEIMIRYLKWLKEFKKGYILHVLWDLYASHKSEIVKSTAKDLEIGLSFIPAGQTDEWQPLDRRIFGILKSQACSQFDNQMISKNLDTFDLIDAIVILINCWSQITQSEVINSWRNL